MLSPHTTRTSGRHRFVLLCAETYLTVEALGPLHQTLRVARHTNHAKYHHGLLATHLNNIFFTIKRVLAAKNTFACAAQIAGVKVCQVEMGVAAQCQI